MAREANMNSVNPAPQPKVSNPLSELEFPKLFPQRKIFAERLHAMLSKRIESQTHIDSNAASSISECLTIGLTGAWGTGKTSILNASLSPFSSADSLVEVVKVNAWAQSGSGNMRIAILDAIREQLGSDRSKLKDKKEWLRVMNKYKKTIGESFKILSGPLGDLVAAGWDETLPPLMRDVKAEIDSIILDKNITLIVVLDDVDRLTIREICDLFISIRDITDFKNTTYLIALDDVLVKKSLKKEFEGTARANYLDKIIDVQIQLPPNDFELLYDSLVFKLEEVVNSYGIDNLNVLRQQPFFEINGLKEYLRPLLTTPRDVVRLCNTVDFNMSFKEERLSIESFILLRALELFDGEIYNSLKLRRSDLYNFYSQDQNETTQTKKKNKANANRLREKFPELTKALKSHGGESTSLHKGIVALFPGLLKELRLADVFSDGKPAKDSRLKSSNPYNPLLINAAFGVGVGDFFAHEEFIEIITLESEQRIKKITQLLNSPHGRQIPLHFSLYFSSKYAQKDIDAISLEDLAIDILKAGVSALKADSSYWSSIGVLRPPAENTLFLVTEALQADTIKDGERFISTEHNNDATIEKDLSWAIKAYNSTKYFDDVAKVLLILWNRQRYVDMPEKLKTWMGKETEKAIRTNPNPVVLSVDSFIKFINLVPEQARDEFKRRDTNLLLSDELLAKEASKFLTKEVIWAGSDGKLETEAEAIDRLTKFVDYSSLAAKYSFWKIKET